MEENKKRGAMGLSIIIIIGLLLICIGMGVFILANKEKLDVKETTNPNSTTNKEKKDNQLNAYYYESNQEGKTKYFLSLIETQNNYGYLTIRYISISKTKNEAPICEGSYSIKNNEIVLYIGPYTNEKSYNATLADNIFKNLGVELEIDTSKKAGDANSSSFYKFYKTNYNENEITIGNKTFYRVK